MIETKTIEIRDTGTFVPALAIRILGKGMSQDSYLIRRAGYGGDRHYVLLTKLNCEKAINYDPIQWGTNDRAWNTVHRYLEINWDSIESGDVLDVEYILGETSFPKLTESMNVYG